VASSIARPLGRRVDHLFFSALAVAILATVFVGFARTYYLAGLFHAPLPNLLVHIHGVFFTCWVLLFVAQTSLVAAHRVDLHRRLGLTGFGVAGLMVVLGVLAATDAQVRHSIPGDPGIELKAFYTAPITDMLAFSVLILYGYRKRSQPAAHKRIMLIATIALLDAAFVRWPVPVTWWGLRAAEVSCYPLLLLLASYDLWTMKKIHPPTLWGSLFLIVLHQVRVPLGHTALWQAFATWVQNFARTFY